MKIVQVHLNKGNDHLTCWLPADAGLKKGSVVTLKSITGKWTVKEIYSIVMEQYEINRKWDVGGL
jgi:hypothetical protein